MNWDNILKNKLAMEKLALYYRPDHILADGMDYSAYEGEGNECEIMYKSQHNPIISFAAYITPRDLYDFFDENNLNLWVAPFKSSWCNFMHEGKGGTNTSSNEEYPTRIEAESAAFEMAFSILEKQLTE